jgi:GT2 family glycosyltransferase
MYRAINAGMRALRAPWLAYLNSDDLVYSDGYARLIEAATAGTADIAYGDGDFVDAGGGFIRSQASFGPALVRWQLGAGTMPFVQPASAFRREIFERLGGFDQRFTCVADYDFFARAAAAGYRFAKATGGPVAAFRVHEGQLSTAQQQTVRREQRLRRRECGRGRAVARRGLSALWKIRNTVNSLTGLAHAGRASESAAASAGGQRRRGDRT